MFTPSEIDALFDGEDELVWNRSDADGGPVTTKGILEHRKQTAEFSGVKTESFIPIITCPTAAITGISNVHTVTFRGKTYNVKQAPDIGNGLSELTVQGD